MSCNIRIPLQQIIDDVAAALSDGFIKTDNAVLNEAVLNEVTIRGDISVDTAARNALCAILQTCGITAIELEWLDRPTVADMVAVSGVVAGEVVVSWKDLDTLITEGIVGKVQTTDVLDSSGVSQEEINTDIRNELDALPFEGGVLADTFVTVTANGLGTVARTQRDKNKDFISVKDFGMVGDGVTNNDIAILKAISSGKSLDWGGVDDVYKITEQVSSTLTSNINWTSNGATIYLETITHQRSIIDITSQGFNVVIKGVLNVLANSKANIGVNVVNYLTEAEAANGYVYMRDVRVKDIRRADASMGGGDGITIYGPFASVILDRPSVENVVMAAGAGVSGSQGASGISISRAGAGSPRYIRIVDAYIDGIRSEDLDYADDQDGIKIFTDVLDHEATAPFKGIAHIIGGTIKNAYGRGIKTQSDNCHISGMHFIRTEGLSRGYGNHEIDMQYGGGSVSDIHINYDGHRADGIVACQQHKGTTLKNVVPMTTVSGVKGTIINQPAAPMAYVFQYFIGLNTEPVIYLEDVNVSSDLSGRVSHLVLITSSSIGVGTGIRARFNISNVEMKVVSALIYQRDPVGTHINMDTVHTTYGTNECKLVFASAGAAGYITLSTQRVTNVIKAARLNGTPDIATGLRLETIIPTEQEGATASGLIKFASMSMPPSTVTNLGSYGMTAKVFLAQVSIAFTGGTQVTLAGGDSTLSIIAPTTPDPALITAAATKAETGLFRFFFQGDDLMVENNDTSARQITMMVVG